MFNIPQIVLSVILIKNFPGLDSYDNRLIGHTIPMIFLLMICIIFLMKSGKFNINYKKYSVSYSFVGLDTDVIGVENNYDNLLYRFSKNNNGGYEIRQYVQIPSPVSLVTQSPLYKSNQEFEDDIFISN